MADTSSAYPPPIISQEDLQAFHSTHFSSSCTTHFATQFLAPTEEDDVYYVEEEEEDDGLGYYADGVKRTLTDEQIAMFRHSEVQALLRDRARAGEACSNSSSTPVSHDEAENGEVREEASVPELAAQQPKNKKRKGNYKKTVKPDLRKRTWDVVEKGMESLEYGDDSAVGRTAAPPSQRRKISYDDV